MTSKLLNRGEYWFILDGVFSRLNRSVNQATFNEISFPGPSEKAMTVNYNPIIIRTIQITFFPLEYAFSLVDNPPLSFRFTSLKGVSVDFAARLIITTNSHSLASLKLSSVRSAQLLRLPLSYFKTVYT